MHLCSEWNKGQAGDNSKKTTSLMLGSTSNSKTMTSAECQEKCIRENGRTGDRAMSRVQLSQETGKGRMTSSKSF